MMCHNPWSMTQEEVLRWAELGFKYKDLNVQHNKLLKAINGMATLLGNKEWADHVALGTEASELESCITELVGENSEYYDRITSLESHNRELLAANQVMREALQAAQSAIDCYDYTDTKDVSDKYIKAERLCAEALAIKTKSNTE